MAHIFYQADKAKVRAPGAVAAAGAVADAAKGLLASLGKVVVDPVVEALNKANSPPVIYATVALIFLDFAYMLGNRVNESDLFKAGIQGFLEKDGLGDGVEMNWRPGKFTLKPLSVSPTESPAASSPPSPLSPSHAEAEPKAALPSPVQQIEATKIV